MRGKKEKKDKENSETKETESEKKETIDIGPSGPTDLTPEREEELINWLADQIVKRGLETPAILFLESVKPVSFVGSQLTGLYAAPFLEIMGIRGYEWASFFSKRENVERLLQKIEKNVETQRREDPKHATCKQKVTSDD